MKEDVKRNFKTIADQCSGCGVCADECGHLQNNGDDLPGGMAKALSTGDVGQPMVDFLQKCSLCGLCNELCPEEIDIPGMVKTARTACIEAGAIDPEHYRFLWVDHDWNAFSLFRRAYGVDEDCADMIKERCELLFFPGCMLANEGPQLVKAAADWLGQGGEDVGASLLCCGAPLEQMGLEERVNHYTRNLWRNIEATGARQVITACPTCHDRLVKTSSNRDVEVVSIFKLMAASGLCAPSRDHKSVTVHDSCSARNGKIGAHVRKLLRDYEIKEMAHHGAKTVCCGSGGIVSAVDPEICEDRAAERSKEVRETGADMCITYCMSCAHRLNGQSDLYEVRHILELVLNKPVDHEDFDEKCYGMWEGDAGEENANLLLQSKVLNILPPE